MYTKSLAKYGLGARFFCDDDDDEEVGEDGGGVGETKVCRRGEGERRESDFSARIVTGSALISVDGARLIRCD